MHHCNNDHRSFLYPIVDAEGETLKQCAMRASNNFGVHGWSFCQKPKCTDGLYEELLTWPRLLFFVSSGSVFEILFGLIAKPNRKDHNLRRMSASTSSTGRP